MTEQGLDARTASLTTALLDQVDPGHQPEGPTGAQLLGVQRLGCATLALGVITGLQERFDWRGVAASSVAPVWVRPWRQGWRVPSALTLWGSSRHG